MNVERHKQGKKLEKSKLILLHEMDVEPQKLREICDSELSTHTQEKEVERDPAEARMDPSSFS